MPAEKPPSIMCEICKGWHTTESHTQYEKEMREKRMAEIKARPDSAYRFDTLGFTPENTGEIESWMHTVIEKAKDLGDDLQDSDFFVHSGNTKGPMKAERPEQQSAFSLITQTSFLKAFNKVFVMPHMAGQELRPWAFADSRWYESFKKLLTLQEQYVTSQDTRDLSAYQQAIEDLLRGVKRSSEATPKATFDLSTTQGRKSAVEFLQKEIATERDIGFIFQINDQIKNKFACTYGQYTEGFPDAEPPHSVHCFVKNDDGSPNRSKRLVSARIQGDLREVGRATYPEIHGLMTAPKIDDEKAAEDFYHMFIHGLHAYKGSVDHQRELLARMLEITKDHPEQRLPIYNFYGRLVWPQPPKEDK